MRDLLSDPLTWAHMIGYAFAILLPAWPLYRLGILWWRLLAHEAGVPENQIDQYHRRDLPFLIGAVERGLYVASWLVGKPEFVGVWLVLKVAGSWKAWADDRKICWTVGSTTSTTTVIGRHLFNTFLLGTALSLLNGFTWALGIEWFVQADRARALAVPALVTAITFAWWGITELQWKRRPRAA